MLGISVLECFDMRSKCLEHIWYPTKIKNIWQFITLFWGMYYLICWSIVDGERGRHRQRDGRTDGQADVFHTSQYLDMYIIIYTVYIYIYIWCYHICKYGLVNLEGSIVWGIMDVLNPSKWKDLLKVFWSYFPMGKSWKIHHKSTN